MVARPVKSTLIIGTCVNPILCSNPDLLTAIFSGERLFLGALSTTAADIVPASRIRDTC